MDNFKIVVFADKPVGLQTIEYLLQHYPHHVRLIVVTDSSSQVFQYAIEHGFDEKHIFFSKDLYRDSVIGILRSISPDYILLAWWPYIVKQPILSLPRKGVLNFHPSLLPYGQGKDANFWALVEDTLFGVSIILVDESIDGGDIVFQKPIPKVWEDTGETLYRKACEEMLQLFIESYPRIVNGNYVRIKQNSKEGSFHYRKELEPASQIYLDREYKARDLLNLLRARTFPPYPACYFYEDGEKYEVFLQIRKEETNYASTRGIPTKQS